MILEGVKSSLVLQWLGLALVAVAVAVLAGWPWGVLAAGAAILLVGVAGEVADRSSEETRP